MPLAVTTYTPHKVTEDNKSYIPSDHPADGKVSYMQVEIKEAEMAVAIQMFIRSQMPVAADDEMPVTFIAGRGENGHSAVVTIKAAPINVKSPERPSPEVAGFEAAHATVTAKNSSTATPDTVNPVVDPDSVPDGPQETPPTDEELADAALDNLDTNQVDLESAVAAQTDDETPSDTETPFEGVVDTRDEQPVVEPRKASSLFAQPIKDHEDDGPENDDKPLPKSTLFGGRK